MAHSELEAGPSQSLAKLPLTPTSRPLAAEHVTATDTDTCRICRGEGTVSEPLFFPCKCSGSIKYVHQDCLMEWLSHSQKKHCELCKTPFRFTKLYDPNMPKTLPPFVFVRHMTKYLVRNLLVWLRAILVVSIWLGWVPYAMRAAWSLLFWISDEGLGGGSASLAAANGSGVPAWRGWRGTFSLTGDRTCPSSPLFAATTTVSTIGGVMNQVETDDGMLPALLRLLHRWNLTDPLYSSVLKLFLGTPPISPTPLVVNTISEAAPGLMKALSHNHTSLLSDVDFLRNIARHPVVSRTIIAILEGQIITVLVIISFILIILVRDYVVQQQPEINMRAAFAAAENLPVIPPPGPAQNAPNQAGRPAQENRDEVDNAPSPASENQGAPTRPQPAGNADIEQRNVQATPEGSAPSGAVQGSSSSAVSVGATGAEGRLVRQRVVTPLSDAFQARPENTTPSESATAPTPGSSGDSLRVKDFSRISRKAGGDREKFLQIIKDENLEDALQYWVQLTNAQNERDHHNGESSGLWQSRPSPESSGSHASGHMAGNYISETSGSATGSAALAPRPRTPLSDSSSSRSALEPAAPAQSDMDTAAASLGKGKGKDAETHLSVDGGLYPSRSASSRSDWMQGVSSMRPQPTSDTSTTHLVEPETPSLSRSASSQMSGRQSDVALSGAWIDSVGPPDRPGDENTLPSIPDDRSLAGTSDVTGVLHDLEDVSMVAQASIAGDSLDSSDFPTEGEQNAAAPTRPPEVHHRHQARGVFGRLAEFMWGGIEARPHEHGDGGDDAAEDGHDFADVDMDDVDEDFGRDDDGAAPGMDPEAVEDAEDFEGIMELIGMRGPIAGLFQNAIFCAFLVVITILLGIFVPYNIGRAAIWTVVNPTRPIRVVIGLSKFIQDLTMLVVGLAILVISVVPYLAGMLIGWNPLQDYLLGLFKESTNITALSYNRIIDGFVSEPFISASEIRNFSAISHASLLTLKQHLLSLLALAAQGIEHVASGQLAMSRTEFLAALSKTTASAWEYLASLQHVISHPGSWVINFQSAQTKVLVDPELAYWNGWDRFWAILFGYMAISLVAGLYLRRGVPFSSSQTGQEWEASIIDALNQASGVMKVILIISIEMLIFPLYCGMLLDVALLPLFENTTILSRILFTYNKPLTSIFVHWFVGTGYMFHFALFVSMCRKIMRKGVLYFIRDPDDPEFHPVRDVLERSVTTQLRKILFSAFVYGALVIVCLGGVVWGLSFALPNVLPIHYSSNEPVLEFPIDLLFYNFLMPLAVKVFKPSDGLHVMYTWWFRRCARALRLTWFLFGERRIDEEGTLYLPDSPEMRALPWWRKLFVEIDENGAVVPKSWKNTFDSGKPSAHQARKLQASELKELHEKKQVLIKENRLKPSGRFVRTPASDQVKIPKGRKVFLEVSPENERLDGDKDRPDSDLYSSPQYQFVYIPPHFRLRIFLFILFIWLFAAVTGVGITIVPLIFGRRMFKMLIPEHVRTNDIYAFSIGIYILGSAAYSIYHARTILNKIRQRADENLTRLLDRYAIRQAALLVQKAAQLVYSYAVLTVVLPALVAALVEFYVVLPLHTYMYPPSLRSAVDGQGDSGVSASAPETHTMHAVQAWTLGILYLKLLARGITYFHNGSRLAGAVRAVMRNGWLDPDARVLTRAFLVPGLAVAAVALALPLVAADLFIRACEITDPADRVLIYRNAFPANLGLALAAASAWMVVSVFESWKTRIRDEAYLIGERLHNFGVGAATNMSGRGASGRMGEWRAGANRL